MLNNNITTTAPYYNPARIKHAYLAPHQCLTPPTHRWVFSTGPWLCLEEKEFSERCSCNFALVLRLSFADGSWQNWDCNTNARRPSTYESKLCTISLFSDSVSPLFKNKTKSGVGTVSKSWRSLKIYGGTKRPQKRRKMLMVADGRSSFRSVNKMCIAVS